MVVSLIAPLIILAFQMSLFYQQMATGESMNLSDSSPYIAFHILFQSQTLMVFSVALAISFVICFVLGVIISHRIAGPLVKLKKHFESIAQDEKNDDLINFRENDFFKELATAYNLKFEKKN